MSNYSASIYSVDESGERASDSSLFHHHPLNYAKSLPQLSQPPPVPPPLPSTVPALPQTVLVPQGVLENPFGTFGTPFVPGEESGSGMKDLSDITIMAERVVSNIQTDSDIGSMIGTIKQKLLRRHPDFVPVLKELSTKIEETALAARLSNRFKNIELYRVDKAVQDTFKELQGMMAKLDGVIGGEKRLPRHVREKLLLRLGKLHYSTEQLVKGIEPMMTFRHAQFDEVLEQIRGCRLMLKQQNGVGF